MPTTSTIDAFLVPQKTIANAKGDGPALDIGAAANRVFLLTLDITNIIEQQALDVSVYGSADGASWGTKPLIAFPQKFYRGQHPSMYQCTRAASGNLSRLILDKCIPRARSTTQTMIQRGRSSFNSRHAFDEPRSNPGELSSISCQSHSWVSRYPGTRPGAGFCNSRGSAGNARQVRPL